MSDTLDKLRQERDRAERHLRKAANDEKMKKEIRKASACKRLINPDDCNPKCIMGYTFVLDGEWHQKCRYMAFQLTLSEESNPYIMQFLEKELRV